MLASLVGASFAGRNHHHADDYQVITIRWMAVTQAARACALLLDRRQPVVSALSGTGTQGATLPPHTWSAYVGAGANLDQVIPSTHSLI